jgi:GGDEF domain-containing protein
MLIAIVAVTRRLRRPIDELAERADLDPVTGVLNPRAFFEQTTELLGRCRSTGRELVVAVLDIDDF